MEISRQSFAPLTFVKVTENLFQLKNGGAKCLRLKKDAIPSILPPKKRSSSKEEIYSAPKKPRGSRKVLEVKLDLGRTKVSFQHQIDLIINKVNSKFNIG